MPATPVRLATVASTVNGKNDADRSRFYDFLTVCRYAIISFFYLFDKSFIRKFTELSRDVSAGVGEVFRENSWRQYFKRLARGKRLQKTILCPRHIVRFSPDCHNVYSGHDLDISSYCTSHETLLYNHSFVISFMWVCERRVSNDSPAARRIKAPGGVTAPNPVVVERPCRKTTSGGLKVAKRPAESTPETSSPAVSTTQLSAKPWREGDEL